MNNREENSDSIPNDLILEILSRLPITSIGRFRCVSKQWGSMLHKPYFTKLFFTRSSARPRLLIGVRQHHEWSFFSAPQPQNHYGKSSSLVVAADFHIECSFLDHSLALCNASGLLYFPSSKDSRMDEYGEGVICNPITGQFSILPRLRLGPEDVKDWGGLIGFDPIGGQFKVLSMKYNRVDHKKAHYILTLGTEKERWREIECPFNTVDRNGGVCINRILYYVAYDYENRLHLLGCFDVRSEKFKFLTLRGGGKYDDLCTRLINYKGKLGLIRWSYLNQGFFLRLRMWVQEDLEKQEWSSYFYILRLDDKLVKVSVVGVTAAGDIVLANDKAYKPFYVFYLNLERNHLLSVEIQCLGEYHIWHQSPAVCVFVDHVEDLQFNSRSTTSLNPPEQKLKHWSISASSRNYHHVRRSREEMREIIGVVKSIRGEEEKETMRDDDEGPICAMYSRALNTYRRCTNQI